MRMRNWLHILCLCFFVPNVINIDLPNLKALFQEVKGNVKLEDRPNRKTETGHKNYFLNQQQTETSVGVKERAVHRPRQRRQLHTSVDNSSSSKSQDPLRCPDILSCKDNCSSPIVVNRENRLSCFCDDDCSFFMDCCADYDEFCAPQNSSHSRKQPSNQEKLINNDNKRLWRCYNGRRLLGSNGVWMIGTCPDSWPKDQVFHQCKNLSDTNTITKENYRYLPVYTSNGRVYHNQFCAQCNGVHSKDLKEYKLYFGCDVLPSRTSSAREQIDFLFSHCNSINWAAQSGAPRRFCLALRVAGNQLFGCRRDIDGKCSKGPPRIVYVPHYNYKNKHCADLCDGSGRYHCGPGEVLNPGGFLPTAKPFSVLFDFGDNSKDTRTVKVTCPFRKPYYDPYLEICRPGSVKNLQLLQKSKEEEYEIIMWVNSHFPLSQSTRNKLKTNISDSTVIAKVMNINNEQISRSEFSAITQFVSTIKFNLKVFLRKEKNRTRRSLDVATSLMSLNQILNLKASFHISILAINFTVIKVTSKIISCINLQKYSRREYTVLSDDRSAVAVMKTKEILYSNEYYTLDGASANDSQAISVCRQYHRSNCSGKWALMEEGEFVVLENKTIFVNSSKHVFDPTKYIWQNRSILVCENFSTTFLKKVEKKDDKSLVILTYVCMVMSIIALVFVLVTYSLFSELRTPPGINLMNLSTSILLAQVLWLLGSGQTDKPIACTAIAVLLHYFFLVSFVWTSIIAFDTWRAFTAKGRRSLGASKRKRLMHCLRYMAVGWLSVMVYVAICVILDLTNAFTIGYQSSKACWMENPWAICYFLAIPVGLVLIFNTVFYVLTVKAINISATQARAASNHNDRKQNFGIYVRIGLLMGFTWIFGFIAVFGLDYLWYVFVLLNNLQGVYIALAFALNQRARNLYKNRFPCLACLGLAKNSVQSDGINITSRCEKLSDEHKIGETKL